ncbi:MAG: ABC-2 transporter permease [Lachnospiraceae bacterium]
MRGLLEKDFRLLWKRKNYLLMIGVLVVLFSTTMDGYFIASYVPIICVLLTVSTISYDEFDNGYPFLMVLPITPKTYAVEKYVLAAITGGISFLFTIILFVVETLLQNQPIDMAVLMEKLVVFVPFYVTLISILVPTQLKFGSEKSRVVILLIAGIVFLAVILGKKIISLTPEGMTGITGRLQSIPDETFLWTGVVLLVFFAWISAGISISIMNHKEY